MPPLEGGGLDPPSTSDTLFGGGSRPPKSLRHSLGGGRVGGFRCTPPPQNHPLLLWQPGTWDLAAADAVGTVRVHRESWSWRRSAIAKTVRGRGPSSYITPASLDSVFIIDALGHLTCQVLSINDGAREDCHCAASTA